MGAMTDRQPRTRRTAWRRLIAHGPAGIAAFFLTIMIMAAVVGPMVSPYDAEAMNLATAKLPPSWEHPLGTDRLGRDNLTRVLIGGRISLLVAASAVTISTALGAILGLVAGFQGGLADTIISRVTEIFMSFPQFVLLIVLVSILGPGIRNVVLILGIFGWMMIARVVRGQTLQLRQSQFVEASISIGAHPAAILLRHILPNLIGPIIVAATLGVAGAMLSEAALSFLGLGIQPPTASWGNMLNAAQSLQVLVNEPWMWIGPGLAITTTVLAVNYLGDGLRDVLDPRSE